VKARAAARGEEATAVAMAMQLEQGVSAGEMKPFARDDNPTSELGEKGTQLPRVNKQSTQAELDAAVAALQKATVAVLNVMAIAKAAKRCA
jgi:hypothetical protein